jgi:2-methylisocitrate lyase-like PEP mutase family enzyme
MVGRITEQYMQAGVAAFHLEDQVVNKRCGHLKNKELVEEDVYISRIRAAVNKRIELEGDIVIIARTDALQSLGYDAAVSRLKAAIKVGADVAFLEGIISKEEGKRVCEELAPTPILLNMVPGGITPDITVEEAKQMGFKIIIFPAFALGPVYTAVSAAAKELIQTGNIQSILGQAVRPKEMFEICGLNEAIEFDVAAGGNLFENGV